MRWLIWSLPMLAWAQTPSGTVHGTSLLNDHPAVRLLSLDGREPLEAAVDGHGSFQFADVPLGWYLFAINNPGMPEVVRGIRIDAGSYLEVGKVVAAASCSSSVVICEHNPPLKKNPPTPVLSVCEALNPDSNTWEPVVIVGIYKSGMDPTLRQDCPNQLMSGEVGWLSAIALSGSTEPPDRFRKQIEKKKAEIYASYPPEAKPRPERLVGLYGKLIMPEGLTSAPCCHAQVETTFAPARLIGIDEKDLRVIR